MKKFLSVFIVLAFTCFLFGCADEKKPSNNISVATIEGFEIQSIDVICVEDYFNIEIGIKNTNSVVASFDFSKIKIVKGGTVVSHNGESKEYQPYKYFKWSFSINNESDELSIGDDLSIYYEEQFLIDVNIEEF